MKLERDPRDLAEQIATEIAPEEWEGNAAKHRAFAKDLMQGIIIYRQGIAPADDDATKKARAAQLKLRRKEALERAQTYENSAAAIRSDPLRAAFAIASESREYFSTNGDAVEIAVHLSRLLDDLARNERTATVRASRSLAARQRFTDDWIVEIFAPILEKYEIRAAASRGAVDGLIGGALSIAAARVRGENPTQADWVEKARERRVRRIRKAHNGTDSSS